MESTEPTKMLMRIAEFVDTGPSELRSWFMDEKQDVIDLLYKERDEVEERKRKAFQRSKKG